MNPLYVVLVIVVYFALLLTISYFTSRKANTETFFTANRQSPWYLVAFGMIGASLSGVTFISVPGEVGNTAFAYYQMVIGYLLGYFVIATVLLPLYYRLNLVSIYTYLEKRFGFWSYKTGAFFFLLSRSIGSAARLFLVATVLQIGFFNAFGIPFAVTVIITIFLIYIYTYRAGIKTIVWTDTLQTTFMLLAVIMSVLIIAKELNLSFGEIFQTIQEHPYSKTFFWKWDNEYNFYKQFISGAFIAIVMTGLDQDMMQKNLTCRNLKDAQKNIYWFSSSLLVVNLLFLGLGVLLYAYIQEKGIDLKESGFYFNMEQQTYQNTDSLFPTLALKHFPLTAGIVFLLGIIAAAFSSADSALTSLTTSFCVDILDLNVKKDSPHVRKTKRLVHIAFALVLLFIIITFKAVNDESIIIAVFKVAGYTYGPLLGLYAFGLFTRLKVRDKAIPFIAVASPILSFLLDINSVDWFNGFKFGFFILIVNGGITFLGMLLTSIIYRKNTSLE
jgi:SSS family transporter